MKSTQTLVTGEGNAPRKDVPETESELDREWSDARSDGLAATDQGEQCIYCGKDSWTCEHFDPREEAERNQ